MRKKSYLVIGVLVVAAAIFLALNWSEFEEGFWQGYNAERNKP